MKICPCGFALPNPPLTIGREHVCACGRVYRSGFTRRLEAVDTTEADAQDLARQLNQVDWKATGEDAPQHGTVKEDSK